MSRPRQSAGTAAPRPAATLVAVATVSVLAALAATPAAACSVCIGSADTGSLLVSGARLGVFFLLAVTGAVLGGVVSFFLYLRRRARQAEIDGIAAEWAQIQRSASS